MQNGWVKLHRSTLENDFLNFDNSAYIVFTKLLMTVNKNTGKYTTGRYRLAELTNLKPSTAWDALKRLELNDMVKLMPDSKKTVIYICNWSKFQDLPDIKPTSNRHQTDTKQELRIKKYIDKSIYGKPEINEMFDFWNEATNMPIKSQVQKNRNACQTLLNQHKKEGLEKLISGVSMSHSDQYAPKITNFVELLALQNKLMLWGKQKTQGKVVKV